MSCNSETLPPRRDFCRHIFLDSLSPKLLKTGCLPVIRWNMRVWRPIKVLTRKTPFFIAERTYWYSGHRIFIDIDILLLIFLLETSIVHLHLIFNSFLAVAGHNFDFSSIFPFRARYFVSWPFLAYNTYAHLFGQLESLTECLWMNFNPSRARRLSSCCQEYQNATPTPIFLNVVVTLTEPHTPETCIKPYS